MHAPRRLAAVLAATAALTAATPAVAGAAIPTFTPPDNSNLCLKGVIDLGPLGPMGPYGPNGPWGPNGPMHGQRNPLGNVAECGGFLTFILRGGTLESFVQANTQALGQH
jgi:hypothetical protein